MKKSEKSENSEKKPKFSDLKSPKICPFGKKCIKSKEKCPCGPIIPESPKRGWVPTSAKLLEEPKTFRMSEQFFLHYDNENASEKSCPIIRLCVDWSFGACKTDS